MAPSRSPIPTCSAPPNAGQPHKYTDGHYLVVRPATASDTTHLLVFETDGRVVTSIRGGQKPQVEYVEGCA